MPSGESERDLDSTHISAGTTVMTKKTISIPSVAVFVVNIKSNLLLTRDRPSYLAYLVSEGSP